MFSTKNNKNKKILFTFPNAGRTTLSSKENWSHNGKIKYDIFEEMAQGANEGDDGDEKEGEDEGNEERGQGEPTQDVIFQVSPLL